MNPTFRSMSRRHIVRATAALCALGVVGIPHAQQPWPAKPIRLVVGFAPGGTTDVMARLIAQPMQKALGQPVIVDNKPGASSNLAAVDVIKSPADGYTLLVAPTTVESANPSLFKGSVNPVKDLTPVAGIGRTQLYLVAKNALPVKNAKDLVAMAQASPGRLSYGSGGPGTSMHLVGELFKQQTRVDVTHVPYRGAAPALQDVLGGQIDYFFDPGTGFQHFKDGRAKMLAVASSKRSPFFPEVPTLSELGFKGVELDIWFGIWAPAGTPPDVVARVSREVAQALALPAVKQRYAELGGEPIAVDTAEFRTIVTSEAKLLSALIKERRIVVD